MKKACKIEKWRENPEKPLRLAMNMNPNGKSRITCMSTNIAVFTLVLLLTARATINQTEVKVLNTNAKGGIVKVEMWLSHTGKWEVEFHVKNNTGAPVSFNANIGDMV